MNKRLATMLRDVNGLNPNLTLKKGQVVLIEICVEYGDGQSWEAKPAIGWGDVTYYGGTTVYVGAGDFTWAVAVPPADSPERAVFDRTAFARLHEGKSYCFDCKESPDDGPPIFGVNVAPYRLTCHGCGVVLIESNACELFNGR